MSHRQVGYNDLVETKPLINPPTHKTQLSALENGWEFLPVVAVIGGAWAFAAPFEDGSLTALISALVLVLSGWTPLWRTLTRTMWSTAMKQWQNWHREASLPHWPYLQPDTPGAAVYRALRQARSWWCETGHEALRQPLRATFLALIVSVLAGLILGRTALWITLLMIAWTEIAVLWHEGRGDVGAGWAAGALIGLPWLLGASLGTVDMTLPGISALILTVLMGFYAHPSPVAMLGPLGAASFLIWQTHFVAAGAVLMLAVPGLMVLLQRPSVQEYRRVVTPWLAAMIVLMAWVL